MKELIINEIFFAILEGIFIFLIFSIVLISERKKYIHENKHKVWLFIAIYTTFSFWITLSFPFGYHTLILNIFSAIVLSVITKNSLILAIVAFTIPTILLIITELLITVLLNLFFQISINDIIANPAIKMKFSVIAKTVQMTIGVLLFRSNLKPVIKASENKESTNLLNYSVLGIFLMSIFLQSLNYIIYNPRDLLQYEILLFFIFLVYILFGIFDYLDRIKLLSIKQKYTLQIEYINNLEAVVNILRREKHDYLNHLNAINAICTLNKPNSAENIKSYVGKLADDLKESYKVFDTGNVYIDGLLVVKSNFAHRNDISLDVEIEAPLSHLDIKDNDIISIISNILDNAFDSITSIENHDSRVVSLCTYIEGNEYFISIANTGPKIPEDILPKIFENGFSTKPQKSEHGLGLYIVNNLVKKYDGHIEAYSSDIETQFLIKFPLKDEKHG
ncbi:sensor histidine kinase [Lutispora saccharofermentans]|uniref:GHKL domain-containing protein n=1 Tax=Lutispora saccharofermentans TaxID=3024236 RepID=A0ABT1NGN8_9FIRM|nr:ATP-binding protein [Lutispora saccharofermentans]MCQ1530398.1 GHKL domain-containing protein [Lutispora saccharofermentans]